MISKKIKIPIYELSFTVIIYDDPNKLKSRFKDVDFVPDVERFDGGVFEDGGNWYLVLESYTHKGIHNPTPGTIAHEAKHMVNMVFDYIHQELSVTNDEAECYLLGYIVDEIHKLLHNGHKPMS